MKNRSEEEETVLPAINIANMTGKLQSVPMKPKGAAGMKEVKTESGDPQRRALRQTISEAVPSVPSGGKINILV